MLVTAAMSDVRTRSMADPARLVVMSLHRRQRNSGLATSVVAAAAVAAAVVAVLVAAATMAPGTTTTVAQTSMQAATMAAQAVQGRLTKAITGDTILFLGETVRLADLTCPAVQTEDGRLSVATDRRRGMDPHAIADADQAGTSHSLPPTRIRTPTNRQAF